MYKRLLSISTLILFSLALRAQTPFWSEDFGTGCDQGLQATAYVGPNGSWNVSNTGTNAATANLWYVSAMERNTGAGNCGIEGCGTNRTLHVGSQTVLGIPADPGAAYYEGLDGFCGFFPCGATSKRIESPVIDCSGQSSIEISFLYIEGGNAIDNATLWYNDGVSWSLLENMPKTPTSCAPQGTWTERTVALPSSADNNTSVQIGFQWINNDDGDATDPSIAVDDIVLSGIADTGSPIALCQNLTISLEADGTASISPEQVDNGSSDDISISSLSLDISDFNCSDIGPNTVVLTVTDGDGNSSTCEATITIIDDSPPIAECSNIEVILDAGGNASIVPSDLDGGSSDNCGAVTFSANITTFDTNDLGTNAVVLSVTDSNGNTSTCASIVTVVEFTEPCPYDLNNDGFVNTGDLTFLLSLFGTTDPAADFNDDGVINSGDLVAFLAVYGNPC